MNADDGDLLTAIETSLACDDCGENYANFVCGQCGDQFCADCIDAHYDSEHGDVAEDGDKSDDGGAAGGDTAMAQCRD